MDLLALTGSVPGYSATTLHLRYIVRRRNLDAGALGIQRRRWLDFHHTRYRHCSGSQLPAEFNGFSTLPKAEGTTASGLVSLHSHPAFPDQHTDKRSFRATSAAA